MVNDAGATAPKTPPHPLNSASGLKSTPLAVGTAAISEHIKTVGVHIDDVRPWIARDVDKYIKGKADGMLQELLCGFEEHLGSSEKSKLLQDSLEAVLDICNNTPEITDNLTAFANCTIEPQSYPSFVRAANAALLKLSSLEVSGLPASPHDDETDILFHHNDHNIIQMHQGVSSTRRPDVVLVSRKTAKSVGNDGERNTKGKGKGRKGNDEEVKEENAKLYMNQAVVKPEGNFKWIDVRSTVEFKRKNGTLTPPALPYEVTKYAAPKTEYLDLQKATKNTAERKDSATAPAAAPARAAASRSTKPSNQPQPTRASERLKERERIKRKSDDVLSNERVKRSKTADENRKDQNDTDEKEQKEPKRLPPNIQNGIYVAEIFAANIALQRVISYVINNDIIYIWYFDREHTIQCAGINFIQDLPRFLVLLLAMQRMTPEQWGHNSHFTTVPGVSCDILVDKVDLKLDLTSKACTTHYGLRGRATNVFPVTSKYLSKMMETVDVCGNDTDELVAKLYWPEERRRSEGEILQTVYDIAMKESTVKGHVPDMVWSHTFNETSTANIRKALGIEDQEGSRVLYIIVFRKLSPITELSGDEFLRAWWQVVLCHYTLWKNDVYHRDVSPNNLMVYKLNGKWIGVLNDFDLSSILRDGPRGNERTGTVPFMATDLLEEDAIEGKVEHLYRHDVESFIWVLVWVCLRYRDGKLLLVKEGRLLDDWLKVDAVGCEKEKSSFLRKFRHGGAKHKHIQPSSSHLSNWKIAVACLRTLHYAPEAQMDEDESILETWLLDNVKPVAPDIILEYPVNVS